MRPVIPCLFFESEALEAAELYTAVVPGSRITATTPYPDGMDFPGTVMTVEFELAGQPFLALNGRSGRGFTEAFSLQVFAGAQEELDRMWEALLAGGGQEVQCGWLTDRFGVSWQVVPEELAGMLTGDPAVAARVAAAMMPMVKLDIAALRQAAAGTVT